VQLVDGLDLQRQQDLEHADVQGVQPGVRHADADQQPAQAAGAGAGRPFRRADDRRHEHYRYL